MNLVEPVLFQCKLNPLNIAICVPGAPLQTVTYGMLAQFIHNAARSALKAGIAPGDTVATYVTDTVLHASLTLGLMYMGATTLSLRTPSPIDGIPIDVVLTDVPGNVKGDATVLSVDFSWVDGVTNDDQSLASGQDDDICRIILTSGSTGMSKGVALSHRTMQDRTLSYTTLRGPHHAQGSRLFCDLGLNTSPGIHYLLSSLGRGGTIYFLGPDPADILQFLDLHEIDGMATSPFGLGEFLRFFEADSAFDVSFDYIICQGALLSRELSQRARARMCQNVYSSYGATETSTVAFGAANVTERTPGAVGYVQPGVTIQAVDGSGQALPYDREGLIRIRSHQMANGYFGDAEATRQFFRDGFFYTGDIGRVTSDGLLVITGREKTALNVGGDTVTPERIEDVITSFEGVREAGVFAFDNELGVTQLKAVIVASASLDETALRSHCAAKLQPACVPVRFFTVDALPRGGQGKLERHRLSEIASAQEKGA